MNHEGAKARNVSWMRSQFALVLGVFVSSSWFHLPAAELTFDRIDALFQKHCLDCHNAKDAEGQLILESYDLLMKGGEDGAVVLPGKSNESILVKSVEGSFEKDGKRQIMPPGSKRKKLDSEEVALIRTWIDAGAKGPTGQRKPIELVTPKIPLKSEPRRPINSLAFAPQPNLLAVARYGEVEVWNRSELVLAHPGPLPRERENVAHRAGRLSGHRGNVNAIVFSADGSQFFAAA